MTPSHPSPNFSDRDGFDIQAVVIHIFAGSLDGTTDWLQRRKSQVSYHYGIGVRGNVRSFVRPQDRAWHAGSVSEGATFQLRTRYPAVNPNKYTIGIGHEGHGILPWTQEMWDASVSLTRSVCDVFNIPKDRDHILLHREIRLNKTCPGEWLVENIDRYMKELQADPRKITE